MEPLIESPQQPQENLVVQTFIKDQTKSPLTFKSTICEEDEMYLYSLQNSKGDSDRARVRYYSLGRRIRDAVKQVVEWHFQSFDQVSSFLDFACGYGRFTRFLLQEMPAEQIWVSDIYAGAVQFQSEYLGVNGIVSTSQPENYQIEKKFDCILANSFFSHMPERTFADWMQTLYSLLTPGGLLMFSVHDESLLPPHVKMNEQGILFSPASESRTLDGEEYGTTYVTEQFVRKILDKVSNEQAVVHRIKQGICRFQDLYVVSNQPEREASRLNFYHHPDGHLDVAYFTPLNRLHLEGWAADFNPEGRIEEIQVLVNGEIMQRCRPFFNRPDIAKHFQTQAAFHSGWSCYLPKGKIPSQSVVMIKAINNYGLEWIMETSTLESLLRNKKEDSQRFSTEAKLERLQAQVGETQKQLEQFQAQLAESQDQLEQSQTQLAESQHQLEQSQAQLTATQLQLQTSQDQAARTQSQLEQSQLQLATTQAQFEQSQSQLDRTQGELKQSQIQLASTQTELEKSKSEWIETQAELERVQAQILPIQSELAQVNTQLLSVQAEAEKWHSRVVAMESSKFWQLRRAWFRIKRTVGLTTEND